MLDALRRYGALLLGLVVAGLIGGYAASWMFGPRGVASPLLSAAMSPTTAILAALATLALLTLLAVAVSRLTNPAVGMFVLGWGLCVLAMRSGGAADIAFGGLSPTVQAIETLAWAAAVGGAAIFVLLVGGPLPDVQTDLPPLRSAVAPRALRACAAALLTIPVLWLLLRNDLKGQAIAAALLGGVATGVVGRLWSRRTQPALLYPAGIAALGLGQLAAALTLSVPITRAFQEGLTPRLLVATPVDIAGGVVAGVALGLGWAKSFMAEEATPAASASARTA